MTEKLAVFTGKLAEAGVLNETQPLSMRLHLENIQAESDPESIVPLFSHGVILNILVEQLEESIPLSHLKKGTKVRFTVVGLPPMTMSIPPHVGGQAIELIRKSKNKKTTTIVIWLSFFYFHECIEFLKGEVPFSP